MLVGLPLLLISYGATKTLGATVTQMLPLLGRASKRSLLEVGDGSTIQIPAQIYRVDGIDGLINALIAFFLPSIAGTDPVGRLQAIAFLSDYSGLINIAVIEGIRTGKEFTFASM